MEIKIHSCFKKSYQKRIADNPKLDQRAMERINLFKNDPYNPILKNHALFGKRSNVRAFSITGDVRIIYLSIHEDKVIFLDIGTHNQVY